eukprot:CAMPEP_0197659860 /NCGR_PEP_ID=MMETSP1338-20131121/49454_1 /TAXON_ID=43686 ORGANISM="Pelagodinium beii, Strain RCC1491" /NCGR_SAMPLE_ID=MMETSP1338 /ASSEMBLY_ACC=CAM_ASM_000754 /LENGTH=274 /DNA_ID=CAMNT_0043236993 /DNA_START=71 /DNA_END=893 /DNA_ORIENTATION=+
MAVPEDIKSQILGDPEVQKVIMDQAKAKGVDVIKVLQDPEVRLKICNVAQDKFSEYAPVIKEQISDFVNDPAVKAKAQEYLAAGWKAIGQAGQVLVRTIQQGPEGLRMVSFAAGSASSAWVLLAILNPLKIVFSPVTYVLSAYILLFSVSTMLFEAPPAYIEQYPALDQYQDLLIDKAPFISETLGRGLFYVFVGTLWLAQVSITSILTLVIGLFMVFCGVANIVVHFKGYTFFKEKLSEGYKAHFTTSLSLLMAFQEENLRVRDHYTLLLQFS